MPTLSVFCATRAEPHTLPFLQAMQALAAACGGHFILVADGADAYDTLLAMPIAPTNVLAARGSIHVTVGHAIARDTADYVLCLDDDEICTPALADWLAAGSYATADFWRIPRAWLYPDTQHHITSRKHWPNHAIRIGRRDLSTVPLSPFHAGWLDGPGEYANCPYALEHHKLLIRTLEYRHAEVHAREAITPGAGMYKQYLPECLQVDVAEWRG